MKLGKQLRGVALKPADKFCVLGLQLKLELLATASGRDGCGTDPRNDHAGLAARASR